jgi:ubiquinone/menaquinone biosynthesis C-methylase UbiE
MSTIVLMKAFESVPGRYNLGMRLITFGTIDDIHDRIAGSISTGAKILDIGCGTGELLPLIVKNNVTVSAIDCSAEMVRLAHERAIEAGINGAVTIRQNTAMEVDRLFRDAEFDAVVLSLVMSEMTDEERRWVVQECARVLKPGGALLVADEFCPRSFWKRLAFSTIRLPLHLAAYLYTQIKSLSAPNFWWKLYYITVELPLILISFAVSEPLTQPLGNIEELLPSNLRIRETNAYLYGSIKLLKIRKEDELR